jgi:hypothetical protein
MYQVSERLRLKGYRAPVDIGLSHPEEPLPTIRNDGLMQSGKTDAMLKELKLLCQMNDQLGHTRHALVFITMSAFSDPFNQLIKRTEEFIADNDLYVECFPISSQHPQNTIEKAMVSLTGPKPPLIIVMGNSAQHAKLKKFEQYAQDFGILVRCSYDEADITLPAFPYEFSGNCNYLTATPTAQMEKLISKDAMANIIVPKENYTFLSDCTIRVHPFVKGDTRTRRIVRIIQEKLSETVATKGGRVMNRNYKVHCESSNVDQNKLVKTLRALGCAVLIDNMEGTVGHIDHFPPILVHQLKMKTKMPKNMAMTNFIETHDLRNPEKYRAVCYMSGNKGGRSETLQDSGERVGASKYGNIFTDVILSGSANQQNEKQHAGRVCGNHKNSLCFPVEQPSLHVTSEKIKKYLLEYEEETKQMNDPALGERNYLKRRRIVVDLVAKRGRVETPETSELEMEPQNLPEHVPQARSDTSAVLLENGIRRLKFRKFFIDFRDGVFSSGEFRSDDLYTLTQMISKATGKSMRFDVWDACKFEKMDKWCPLSAFQKKPKRVVKPRMYKTERNIAALCAQNGITELFFTKKGKRYTLQTDGEVFTYGDFSDKSLILVCDHVIQRQGKDVWQDCSFFDGVSEKPLQTIRRPA